MYVGVSVQALLALLRLFYAFPNHVLCRVGCLDLGMPKASAVMLEVLGQAHPHT